MAKFLWIVRLSTYQSIFVLWVDFIFSLSIHQHAPLGIQTPHSFSICSLLPQIKKHQNILLTTIARAFPRKAHQTHLLKLIDIFIIHHFEMILASAWPNISLHLSNGNRGSSGLASARESEQKGPILSPSKYIMNGLATEKKEYSSNSQESILGTIKHV